MWYAWLNRPEVPPTTVVERPTAPTRKRPHRKPAYLVKLQERRKKKKPKVIELPSEHQEALVAVWSVAPAPPPYVPKKLSRRAIYQRGKAAQAERFKAIGVEPPSSALHHSERERRKLSCEVCGERDPGQLTWHHVLPERAGGTRRLSNIARLCVACHHETHRRFGPGDNYHGPTERKAFIEAMVFGASRA